MDCVAWSTVLTRLWVGTALQRFRRDLFGCLGRRDELFELTDALLCGEGPVSSLVGLCLTPEHRRGHGALYDAVSHGEVDAERLRGVLAGLPLPRMFGGRIVMAVDAFRGCARTPRPVPSGCSATSRAAAGSPTS
jgi:hypothetical protein